jgi:hypothetical protein
MGCCGRILFVFVGFAHHATFTSLPKDDHQHDLQGVDFATSQTKHPLSIVC